MDQYRPAQQNQPVKNSAKSFGKIFAVAFLLLSTACAGKKIAPPQGLGSASSAQPVKALDLSSTLGAKLTTVGENFSPRLSPAGGEFLFLSQRRETHQQSQVYVYDLSNLSERRVTYQDGQCDSPIFVKESGDIVYASTTDEIKERPILLRKESSTEIPSELYLSDINGSSIRRLTKHPGFDGNPVDKPGKGNFIYFSQQTDGAKKILQLNLISEATASVIAKKGVSIEEFSPAPNGKKWLWLENDLSTRQQSVWMAEKLINKSQVANLPKGQYQDFSWIDDSHILMSAKLEDKKSFEVMTYDTDKKCLRSFISDKSNLTGPQLAPNQRSLIFVSDVSGKHQIYYRSVNLDFSGSCLNAEVKAPAPAPTTTTTSTTSTTIIPSSTSTTSTMAPAKN